jgi:hypothetical protein
LLIALATYPVAQTAAPHSGLDAVAALIVPPVPGLVLALRVSLLAALVLVVGVLLARPALADAPVPTGVTRAVRIASVLGVLACVVYALTGQAARPLCAALAALFASAALLLPSRARVAGWLLGAVGLGLVGALVVEVGVLRTGLPWLVDAAYAVFGAALLGSSIFGVTWLVRSADDLVATRLAGIALVSGVLTSAAGVAQLALTGPRTWYDVGHSAYGLGAAAQAGIPVLITLLWLAARQPGGRARGVELTRLAAGALVLAFVAVAALPTLATPPAGPEPGVPLLRPVDLGLRHLAVLVTPMRPGLNLVHIGDGGGGQAVSGGHQHGARPQAPVNSLTVRAGAQPVSLTTRQSAPGYWGVVDIPAGTDTLTIGGDGLTSDIPIKVGDVPGDPAFQRVLAGADGPECASVMLGALTGGHRPPTSCPSEQLTPTDSRVLTSTVAWLAGRGITKLNLASDDSPRSTAAAALVRREAAVHRMSVATTPVAGDTLLAVSGWAAGADALTALSKRAVSSQYGGAILAPWLLSAPVLAKTTSEVVPLPFDLQQDSAKQYPTMLATVFPGETPSYPGYLASLGEKRSEAEGPVTYYGSAQVNVPMGGPMDDMRMSGPGSWYPDGALLSIGSGSEPASVPAKP